MVPDPAVRPRGRREFLWALLLAALGVLPRLALALAYPPQPYSDFRQLIAFGQGLQTSWVAKTWLWEFFNPGLPAALSLLFRIFPGPDDLVARLATAVLCGLLGLLPFLLWRGVLPFWARFTAGLLLALWPGQIAFSGVVAQDNWVLLPVVALGALAVRALRTETSWRAPIAAGLLFVLALATRQEMLVTLFPVALAAAGIWQAGSWRWRRLVPFGLAAALLLLTFATQRYFATGRFTVMTKHTGTTVLSSYIPGATVNYWADPVAYVATVRPDLVLDRAALQEEALSLTWNEARRRPWFHTYRIFSALLRSAIEGESDNLYWSLLGTDVQLPENRPQAQALGNRLGPWLKVEMALLLALFLGALFLGIRRKNPAILVLGSFVVLKYGLHVVTMAQGRYFLCVTAIGMLVGVLGLVEALEARRPASEPRRRPALAFGAGAVLALAAWLATPAVIAHVRALDVVEQRVYQFPLLTPDRAATLSCRVERGRLMLLERSRLRLQPFPRDPAPGELTEAVCRLEAKAAARVGLLVRDSYANGGLPGRMVQRVEVDGREVWSHDLGAEAFEGWQEVDLGEARPGRERTVRIQIAAVQPDPGAAWGWAAETEIEVLGGKIGGAGVQRAGRVAPPSR